MLPTRKSLTPTLSDMQSDNKAKETRAIAGRPNIGPPQLLALTRSYAKLPGRVAEPGGFDSCMNPGALIDGHTARQSALVRKFDVNLD